MLGWAEHDIFYNRWTWLLKRVNWSESVLLTRAMEICFSEVSLSMCETMNYCCCPYNYLYRLLRPDEWNAQSKGIRAKRPHQKVSIHKHVLHGSNGASQYISTSASRKAIEKFARLTKSNPTKIAVINCQRLYGVIYVDLTNPVARLRYLQNERAHNYAAKYEEVLVIGYISPHCIEAISDIWCLTLYD